MDFFFSYKFSNNVNWSYSVGTGQTKIHNTAMSALGTQDSNYKYDLMLLGIQYKSITRRTKWRTNPTAGTVD